MRRGPRSFCSGYQTWRCDAVYGQVTPAECSPGNTTAGPADCNYRIAGFPTRHRPKCGTCDAPAPACPAGESVSVDNCNVNYDRGCCPSGYNWSNNPLSELHLLIFSHSMRLHRTHSMRRPSGDRGVRCILDHYSFVAVLYFGCCGISQVQLSHYHQLE